MHCHDIATLMLLPVYYDDTCDYDFYDLLHYFGACAYYYYRLYYDDSLHVTY